MSEQVLKQETRLTDAVERTMMNRALDNGTSISIVAPAKKAFAALGRGLSRFADYIVELGENVHEARMKSERYTRSYW